jgi:transposase-like protein
MMKRWVPLSEAHQRVVQAGYPVTKQAIFYAALSNDAAQKAHETDPHHWDVEESWLTEYIRKALAPVPEGFLSVTQSKEKHGVNVNTVYSWVRKGYVQAERYGAGQGVIYVREADVIRNVEHLKNGEGPTAE